MLLILSAITVSVLLYIYIKWKYAYWKSKGVVQPEPEFPFGNFKATILKKMTFEDTASIYYKTYKNSHKYVGLYMFTVPIWLVTDLALIKRILQPDFQHFTDHFSFHHESQILTNHLFSIRGEKWRTMRAKLTPTFTTGKIKMMFNNVYDLSKKLESSVKQNHVINPKTVSIRDTVARFATDVIASCAFGLETNCIENPDAEFRKYGKRAFHPNKLRILEQIVNWNLLAAMGYVRFPADATNFFMDVVKKTVAYREKNNVRRNDFVDLLLQLKNKGKLEDGGDISKTDQGTITDNDVAAMMFIFYLAGFDTSSSTTSFLFYELASHQEIQRKLRQEVREVTAKYGGKLTYEALQDMHYAQMCIDETLRLYPSAPVLTRVCSKTYQVPESDLVIEKGTQVIIPAVAIQRDPDIYPNPDEFNPENFIEEKRKDRISSTWLPFGDGPRQCIGMRFGYMQVKLSIAALLGNFQYSLHESTPKKLEFMLDVLTLHPEKEILLNVSRVD
ncbi:cytochrome P450 6a9-like [Cylas formicarius]|uniref:cytochrome P450 6a9-like n=1 Tax=Cylas formicarius TaxID=197179 RepID=UPI00295871CB|nr:cytochrome P450 6a9-like [Cylas formicarius]